MEKVIENKRGLEIVTIALKVTKQVQKHSFISYVLSDQVWWCNIKWFLSYSKNDICKFMQVNSWHHNYSTSIGPFESWSIAERTTVKKIWLSQEQKELSRWNKIFLLIFSFGEKIKNVKKIEDTSFNF